MCPKKTDLDTKARYMQVRNPDDWNTIAFTDKQCIKHQMPFSLYNLKNDFLMARWDVM